MVHCSDEAEMNTELLQLKFPFGRVFSCKSRCGCLCCTLFGFGWSTGWIAALFGALHESIGKTYAHPWLRHDLILEVYFISALTKRVSIVAIWHSVMADWWAGREETVFVHQMSDAHSFHLASFDIFPKVRSWLTSTAAIWDINVATCRSTKISKSHQLGVDWSHWMSAPCSPSYFSHNWANTLPSLPNMNSWWIPRFQPIWLLIWTCPWPWTVNVCLYLWSMSEITLFHWTDLQLDVVDASGSSMHMNVCPVDQHSVAFFMSCYQTP